MKFEISLTDEGWRVTVGSDHYYYSRLSQALNKVKLIIQKSDKEPEGE